MGQLDGKVAIVTGAAVGIGRGIAVAFGREGARVVVNYSKSRQEAEETARLVQEAGGQAMLAQADVSQEGQVLAMVKQVVDSYGRIDVLVNNAGVTAHVPFEDLDGLSEDVWDRLYAVNVKGTFFCCRAVEETMRRQGEGSIINIGSIAGLWPKGSSIAYCTSKAAVMHMSKCLATVLGPEIRLNVIAPGFIDETRWNVGRPNLEQTVESAAEAAPLKRVGSPEDMAEVALFLAGSASFVTGAVFTADGGRTLT